MQAECIRNRIRFRDSSKMHALFVSNQRLSFSGGKSFHKRGHIILSNLFPLGERISCNTSVPKIVIQCQEYDLVPKIRIDPVRTM